MNWMLERRPPEDPLVPASRETPENLWVKCPDSGQLVFHKDLEANLLRGAGLRLPHAHVDARQRLEGDSSTTAPWTEELAVPDVLTRPAEIPRREALRRTSLKEARVKTNALNDAVKVGSGTIEGVPR